MYAAKRAMDLVLAILGLVLLSPLLLVLAALVRFKLGSPVFFVQERPGLHGRLFRIIKFRTMVLGASDDEARLTRFGRMLRAASLDELPELINVVKGEMSLVGPRPLLAKYLPLYSPFQARRHEVRPGITGWAQVNGRNEVSWVERFEMDVWYVDNASVWLDAKILVLTLAKVVRRSGISAEGHATMPEFLGSEK